ncbi:6039_t:CDS:2 [Dentiscutata erythropus]|uniref:6039_t:CDS:1 n=1 Tax=Dentiscutata erythropus TaxID=1348616 RepID=A0A9N9EAD5_9GLOM|nr:6039_t:CDS:2 [Dentiscutata erythropus]
MTTSNFSIADIANNLIPKLNRNRIFPPFYNKPEELLPSISTTNSRKPRRSPNSFLLFRKNIHEEIKRIGTGCNMRVISRIAGVLWHNASLDEKQFYDDLAQRCNDLHIQRYQPKIKHQSEIRKRPLKHNYDPYEVVTIPSHISPSQLRLQQEPEPVIYQYSRSNSLPLLNQNPFNLVSFTEEDWSSLCFTFRGQQYQQ